MHPFSELCFCAGRSIKHNKALKRQTQPRALNAWTWRRSPISTCISRWPCIVVLGSQAPPNIVALSVWAHNDLIVTQPLVWRRHFQDSDMLFLVWKMYPLRAFKDPLWVKEALWERGFFGWRRLQLLHPLQLASK